MIFHRLFNCPLCKNIRIEKYIDVQFSCDTCPKCNIQYFYHISPEIVPNTNKLNYSIFGCAYIINDFCINLCIDASTNLPKTYIYRKKNPEIAIYEFNKFIWLSENDLLNMVFE